MEHKSENLLWRELKLVIHVSIDVITSLLAVALLIGNINCLAERIVDISEMIKDSIVPVADVHNNIDKYSSKVTTSIYKISEAAVGIAV